MRCVFLWSLVGVCCTPATAQTDEFWNQFRGPRGDGSSPVTGLPTTFGETENPPAWKTAVAGRAWSSPVVWGDEVWLTNAPEIQNPPGTTARRANGGEPVRRETPIRLSAVCLDLTTGKVKRDLTVFEVFEPQFTHETNSYASPTPVIEDGRLYVHFGTYGTACLDTKTGQKLWERRDINVHHWRGPGSSPVVHGNLLYLTFDGFDHQFLTALNKRTGKTVWKRDRTVDYGTDNGDFKKAYSTPRVIRVGERDLVVSPYAAATTAYDAKTGTPVWTVRHGGMNAAARPLFGNGLVYLNAGDGRNALLAVQPDGRGDVTDTHIRWRLGKLTPRRPSQLLIGNRFFMIDDGGVASCVDALSGEVIWKHRVGGKYWASPVFAGGHIYFFSQNGKITVMQPADKPVVVSSGRLDGGFNASPAIAADALILRTSSHVYCFRGNQSR